MENKTQQKNQKMIIEDKFGGYYKDNKHIQNQMNAFENRDNKLDQYIPVVGGLSEKLLRILIVCTCHCG